jgi:DNA polymerase-3 subunit delta'
MIPLILVTDAITAASDYIQKHTESPQFIEREIVGEKDSISIDQIRTLRKELQIKHVIPQRVIIWQFDSATLEAQNALLKVLEEKNMNVYFYLHVRRSESILPTIRSRCTVIDLRSKDATSYSTEVEQLIEELLQEKQSYKFFSSPLLQPTDKKQAQDFLLQAILVLRNKMKKNRSYAALLTKTFDLLRKIETNNLNPQLSLDQWVLWIKRS